MPINFVFILMRTFYSFNLFLSLITCVLNLEISIVNTYAEIIGCFRLLNKVYNEQYVYSLQKQCLILRNLDSIKPFINIINIEFYGFYYFTTIFHTVLFMPSLILT